MAQKRKVLVFLPSSTGGAERVAVTIGKLLPRDEFEVKFVIVHRTVGTIVKFIPPEYEVIHIPIHNIWCASTIRMARIIRRERPDVVFGAMRYIASRVALAARMVDRNIKVIARMDNNVESLRTDYIMLLKLTFKYISVLITQQHEMKAEYDNLLNNHTGKIIALHNPIDLNTIKKKAFVPNPFTDNGKQTKYVWVGRFHKNKGQDLIVEAFKIVHDKNPKAHLYLIGGYDKQQPFVKDIMTYIHENGLDECVHLVGFEENPYKWVKNCDCFVMPSRLEGLPNALIEAMYLERPVVATKCIPVVSRIVDDGKNGYLAESENILSIAECMEKALTLQHVKMIYKPSTNEDFIRLFR